MLLMNSMNPGTLQEGQTMEGNDLRFEIYAGPSFVYIEVLAGGMPLESDLDAVSLVAVCIENRADRILIHEGVLSENFFKLRTGIAGVFMQKFENYDIKAAIVVGGSLVRGSSFVDMMSEVNRGERIRFFSEDDPAREWLTAESEIQL